MGCEFRGVMMAFRGVRKNEISITTFLILYINHQMFRRDKLSDKRLSGSLFAETLPFNKFIRKFVTRKLLKFRIFSVFTLQTVFRN